MGALAGLLLDLVGNVLGRRKMVYPGFAHNQNRQGTDPHQGRHHLVRHLPGPEFRQIQGAGTGHQQSQPVTENIGRRQSRLQPFAGNLDAVGINSDILGGRGKGHQQPAQGHHLRCHRGIHMGHQVKPRGDAGLREDNPAPPLAQ